MPEWREPPDWGFLCLVVALLQLYVQLVQLASAGHA